MWNEFSVGIAMDTDWFRMLCLYSNTIYEKNRICLWPRLMYTVLLRDWKNKTWGKRLCMKRV